MAEEQLLYRFRKLKHIFEYKELENQEIYFASPEELNDPLEYYQNIVFQGDEVVWENLFKHYFSFIFFNLIIIKITKKEEIFSLNDDYFIKFNGSFNEYPFLEDTYRLAYEEFKKSIKIDYSMFKDKIISNNILTVILYTINEFIIITIMNNISHSKIEYSPNRSQEFTRLLKYAINIPNNPKKEYEMFLKIQDLKYYHINKDKEKNFKFLNEIYYTLPNVYINQLKKLIFSGITIASFTKKFNNSYMWSIYSEKNTGICLIYKLGKTINLLDKYNYTIPFFINETLYNTKHEKINFFNHIGLTIYHDYNKFWFYSDTLNKKSCYYNNKTITKNENISKAKKNIEKHLLDIYKDFVIKTEHWKHEEEYRIFHTDTEVRKLHYHFRDLYGIIFGMDTPYESKQKIVKIILDKCKENNRDITDFHFYQAYFNPETNKIEKYEIDNISIYTPPMEHNNE